MSSEPREYLIRKGGYYYRPNCAGYTTRKVEAGRYTKAEAEREAAVEPWHMSAIHQDDVEDDPVSSRVRMDRARIEALEAENARKDAVIVAMKSQLDCALIREGNEKHRAKIAHQNMNAEINARERAEAENARLREARNRYERKICAAEHGHTINDVLANYRQIRRDIQDRRAREGGNNG